MALLSIAFALTIPSLREFFRGRVLDSEARRLLSLTRYAQSRAISEGVPMILWIDGIEGRYGLEAAAGFLEEDGRAIEFKVDPLLEMEASEPPRADPLSMRPEEAMLTGLGAVPGWGIADRGRSRLGLPRISFLPDGYLGETSPEYIVLRQGGESAVWLTQSTNRLLYELRSEAPSPYRIW
ncbi:MAG: hypothetical protein KF833_06220 [Verrucomicrobiae bacterium]|nr:hypothetical protein [Verrucomicrobiae bacterium]